MAFEYGGYDPYNTWDAKMAGWRQMCASVPNGRGVLRTPEQVIWATKHILDIRDRWRIGDTLDERQLAFMKSASREGWGPESLPWVSQ